MALTLSGTSGITGAGIGTIGPSGANITGVGTFTQGHFSDHIYIADTICHTGDTNTKIRFPSNDTISFETGASQQFLISATGQLQATGAADVRLTLGSSGTAGTNDSVHIRADSENLNFMAASGGVTKFEVNGSETFRIGATGHVSIGGASNDPPGTPDGNLHIQDGSAGSVTADTAGNLATFEDSASNGISILVPSDERANIYFGTSGTNGQIEAGIQYAHESVSTAADRRDMIFRVGGGEKVRFQGTGGISFNGDSAAENALDDFEYGTWTPAYQSTGGTYGYATQEGWYCKVGKFVTVRAQISTNSVSATSHNLVKVTGLPFQVAYRTPGSIRCNGFQSSGTLEGFPSAWSFEHNQTYGELQRFNANGNTDFTTSTMNNSTHVYLAGTYKID